MIEAPHGTVQRYRQGCRGLYGCEACRLANTAYMRVYRAQKRGSPVPVVKVEVPYKPPKVPQEEVRLVLPPKAVITDLAEPREHRMCPQGCRKYLDSPLHDRYCDYRP